MYVCVCEWPATLCAQLVSFPAGQKCLCRCIFLPITPFGSNLLRTTFTMTSASANTPAVAMAVHKDIFRRKGGVAWLTHWIEADQSPYAGFSGGLLYQMLCLWSLKAIGWLHVWPFTWPAVFSALHYRLNFSHPSPVHSYCFSDCGLQAVMVCVPRRHVKQLLLPH